MCRHILCGESCGLARGALQEDDENIAWRLVQLSVVKENRPARRLYESAGFLEFGMEPKASKLGDKYYDEAHMALDFSRPVDFSQRPMPALHGLPTK
jgi:ribosomal protein S18 acetylase RimI-like enzyme